MEASSQLGVMVRILEALPLRITNSIEPGPDGCWDWTGSRGANGYGQTCLNGKKAAVHRVLWSAANGRAPKKGHVIMHSCDNPPCCNPAHLRLGTYGENSHDMHVKGRRCGFSGITPEVVLEIRSLWGSGKTQAYISASLGLRRNMVHKICRRKTWKHI